MLDSAADESLGGSRERTSYSEPGTGRRRLSRLTEPAPADWPPSYPDPFPGADEPPEIGPADLSSDLLGGAILHHGCLVVRELLPAGTAADLAQAAHHAFEHHDRWAEGDDPPHDADWFTPTQVDPSFRLEMRRKWVRQGGAVWLSDSPRALEMLLGAYADATLMDALTGYLGERPVLSINKSTMRCVPPGAMPSWHQDGAFMGRDLRTINCWVALSANGPADPNVAGLDIVPARIDHLVTTGGEGTAIDHQVSDENARAAAAEAGVLRPSFEAGDALLFDEMFLHRTGTSPGMTGDRLAIESWFFAGSHFPTDYATLEV